MDINVTPVFDPLRVKAVPTEGTYQVPLAQTAFLLLLQGWQIQGCFLSTLLKCLQVSACCISLYYSTPGLQVVRKNTVLKMLLENILLEKLQNCGEHAQMVH